MSVPVISSVIFQNAEDTTQRWDLEMSVNGITATATKPSKQSKSVFPSGENAAAGGPTSASIQAGKLKYENGNWIALNSDGEIFLKNKTNLKNLKKESDNAFFDLPEDEQSKIDYTPIRKNIQPRPSVSNLVDDATRSAVNDFPKDPEGFFIGRYPINQEDTSNFDFFKITCYDYAAGLFQGDSDNLFVIPDMDKRKKIRRGVVSLPMQPGISESNNVNWGEDSINPLQVAGANLSGDLIDAGASFLTTGKIPEGTDKKIGKTLNQGFGALSADLIKAFFAQQAVGANLIGRSTGLSINNNLEVLFNGPQLRSFNYNYRFTPREPKEADKVKQIIRFFKKQMAPKRSNSRIFLKSPNVWKLKYTYKNGDPHPFLNNIKICALTGFNVDYTPDGSYATYEDDGGRGDGSMTSYQVGLSFKEITPIYNDDFWNDDEGQEGTGF